MASATTILQGIKDGIYINPYQWHRLFTHEDGHYAHAHKIAGISVMAHFGYRLWHWYNHGHLGFDSSISTIMLMLVHMSLHITSFQFVIPNRRNMVYNVIWPEMRWHSLIFAYRSIAVMFVIWLEQRKLLPLHLDMWARGGIVITAMLLADYATNHYKAWDSTTMRKNPYPSYIPQSYIRIHNLFYSLSQIFATLNMLYRGYDLVFLPLIAIQTAPFCMTLVKKGIINQMGWHVYYTLAILVPYYYAFTHKGKGLSLVRAALFAATARFGLNLNKYVLWAIVIAVHIYNNRGYADPNFVQL